jgi:hypothetical protein
VVRTKRLVLSQFSEISELRSGFRTA